MTKTQIAIYLIFIIVLGIAVACAVSPPIKETIVGALTTVAGAIYTPVSGFWAYLGSIAGASALNFLITTVVLLLTGFIGGTLIYRKASQYNLPFTKKVQVQQPFQGAPIVQPIVIPSSVTPTPASVTPVPQETKKQEAA